MLRWFCLKGQKPNVANSDGRKRIKMCGGFLNLNYCVGWCVGFFFV